MSGTISSVSRSSGIVMIGLTLDDGTSDCIYMELRYFGDMAEDLGIKHVSELEGRHVSFDGEQIKF